MSHCLALPLPSFDEVLQTLPTANRGLAADDAPVVALHPQLVTPLPRNRQVRKLIFNALSHVLLQNDYYRLRWARGWRAPSCLCPTN
jgi:hypothetical protein